MGRGRGRGHKGHSFKHSDTDGMDQASHGTFSDLKSSSRADQSRGSAAARPTGVDLAVHSKTPKFLQPYAHLLEKGNKPARRQRVQSDEDDDNVHEDNGVADAMIRALEEQPELKDQLQGSQVKKMQGEAAKERGNDAFKSKDFAAAVKQYDVAIESDNTNAVYYSNRSAAHAALENWEQARVDAARAANLRPAWSKAWTRLGAALMGLEDFAEAKEAYAKAMLLEPDDKTINSAWLKADYEERQASQADRVAFNKRKLKGVQAAPAHGAGSGPGARHADAAASTGRRGARIGAAGRGGKSALSGAVGREGGGRGGPPEKVAKRAVLSFGGDTEDDDE